ncbi:toxin-activating lysine-acyltransferase [Escherichia coli]|nr:toxin-activating lysine-acyltransferase [Escherichia coli]EFJ8659486.1 toxin-activating lysine-acyltransferase [Escherichia coli]EFJ8666919.1 toxin-activating lysine-acyltransferase [Escherichia coli]
MEVIITGAIIVKKNVTNYFNTLGGVSWLWANSPLHRNWPVSLLAINTLPAIRCNQYALLMKDGFPVAFCSWANLSLKNEIKYLNNVTSLLAEDWTSGERKWFIDWIAPFGDSKYLYKHMRDMYPYDLFRAIRVNPKTNTGKISEFHGGKIDKRLASRIFRQYHNELINEAKKMKSFKFSFSG